MLLPMRTRTCFAHQGRRRRTALRLILLLAVTALGACTRREDLPEFRFQQPTLFQLPVNANGSLLVGTPTLESSGCQTEACLARLKDLCDYARGPTEWIECQPAPDLQAYFGTVFGPENVGASLVGYVESLGGSCDGVRFVTCIYEWDWCLFYAYGIGSGFHYFARHQRDTVVIDPASDSDPIISVMPVWTKTEITRSAYETCARSGRAPG